MCHRPAFMPVLPSPADSRELTAAANCSISFKTSRWADSYRTGELKALLELNSRQATRLEALGMTASSWRFCWERLQLLPCANLRQLQLTGYQLQLAADDSNAGVLQDWKDVTSLVINNCMILDPPAALETLHSVLSSLKHLEVTACMAEAKDGGEVEYGNLLLAPLPSCLLAHTTQLTSVKLSGLFDDETLQHLGGCNKLQQLQLDLSDYADATAAGLAPLEQLPQLSRLTVKCHADDDIWSPQRVDITSTSTPGFLQLTQLKHFELHACGVLEPLVLSRMPHLTHLAVLHTPLQGGAAGAAALLAVLPQLNQLQVLLLSGSLHHDPPPPPLPPADSDESDSGEEDDDSNSEGDGEDAVLAVAMVEAAQAAAAAEGANAEEDEAAAAGEGGGGAAAAAEEPLPEEQEQGVEAAAPPTPPAEAYAALTASTQLQHLDLADCTLHEDAAQFMFPPGLQRQQLRALVLAGSKSGLRVSDSQTVCSSIASCCGNLQELVMSQQDVNAQFVALQQLTSLTKLRIRTASNSNAVQLAALQSLRHLRLDSSSINDFGLLALTALRGLTELRVTSDSISAELTERLGLPTCFKNEGYHIYYMVFQDKWWDETPLWQRLLCDCMLSSQLQPEVLKMFLENNQQLNQQTLVVRDLQQRLVQKTGQLQPLIMDGSQWSHPGGDLRFAKLQQWTALTKLYIPSTSNSMAFRLAELTNLEDLFVEAGSFTDYALLALTALRRLTELRVVSGSFSEVMIERLGLEEHKNNHVYHRVYEGDAGGDALPVWQRLLMDCMLGNQLQMSIVQVLLDHQELLEKQAAVVQGLEECLAQRTARLRGGNLAVLKRVCPVKAGLVGPVKPAPKYNLSTSW